MAEDIYRSKIFPYNYKKVIHCEECKYLYRQNWLMRLFNAYFFPNGSSDYRCDHYTNITFACRHFWLDSSRKKKWGKHPSQRNESNSCVWFKGKRTMNTIR